MVRVSASGTMSFRSIPYFPASASILSRTASLPSAVSGIPFSSRSSATTAPPSAAAKTAQTLARLREAAPNIPVYVLPVPAAGAQLQSLLPKYAPMADPAPVYEMFGDLPGVTLIDPRPVLTEPTDYYKTDHHWTLSGAYKAYALWQAAHGKTAPDFDALSPQAVTDAFYGTLAAKIPGLRLPPDTVQTVPVPQPVTVTADGREIGVYDASALAQRDKYRVYFGGNYGVVDIRNPAAPGGTLLVLKDSYANCLVPMLVPLYHRIVVVDPRYFTGDLDVVIGAEGVTEVLVLYNAQTFAADASLWLDLAGR